MGVGHERQGPVDWIFRDRRTGRVTVVQRPNVALALWIIATVCQLVLDPAGAGHTALEVAATVSLVWWAGDEVLRGVNPWRRFLGGAVLASQIKRLLG